MDRVERCLACAHAVHELDLLGYLFGPITRVYCESGVNTRGFEVDETVAMTLKFASGMVGTFLMSECVPHVAFPNRRCYGVRDR